MKMHKKTVLVASVVVALTILSSMATFAAGADLPKRDTVMWATGFDNSGENLNPWTDAPGYGVAFMYMPLFGWNAVNNSLIKAIGTGYTWSADSTTCTIELNSKAKWSDGKKITADDVVFSFNAAMNTSRFGEIKARVSKVEAKDGKVVLTMFANSTGSLNVKKWLTNDLLIVPKHVWETILKEKGDTYANNWFAADYPYDKVSSGPYEPYYMDDTRTVEVHKKVAKWWGEGELYQDIPAIVNDVTGKNSSKVAPEYIGSLTGLTNTAKEAALVSGKVDLYSGAVTAVADLVKNEPYIQTYYGKSNKSYFLPGGGVITVSFNQEDADPHIKNKDIRTAMAWAIDYNRVNLYGNDGNWVRARMGIIDDRCPTLAAYYNSTIQAKYEITYNMTKAIEILTDLGAVFNSGANTTLNAGTVKPTSVSAWTLAGDPIGPFEINSEEGWGDVGRAAEVWCENWQQLGIPVVLKYVDWNDYQKTIVPNNQYQMLMDCITPQMTNDIMTVLEGYQGNLDHALFSRNTSRWVNDNYAKAFAKFETATDTERLALASVMQEELAKNLAWIPVMVNALWLTYNTEYWDGFTMATGTNNFQQAVSASSTNMVAVKQRMVLNLRASLNTIVDVSGPGAIPFEGLAFAIGAAFVAVSLLTVKKLRKEE